MFDITLYMAVGMLLLHLQWISSYAKMQQVTCDLTGEQFQTGKLPWLMQYIFNYNNCIHY